RASDAARTGQPFMTLTTTKPKMFPLGRPAFVSYVIERAAHLRGDDAKLMAMENDSRSRAFVVHRDSLVVAQSNGEARPLLTLNEALGFGANPGTIFLGLRDGAAVFGMGIGSDAVEKLLTRSDVVLADIRAMVTGGGL